ncbi:MAG TPA: dihydrodipicolinate synthase family protein, partial [Candidatus Baltobacteraceae bacterium]|nr:dihydrodipicolinate synthase family protein [Candidatus Baltobacteraceae bacterium]
MRPGLKVSKPLGVIAAALTPLTAALEPDAGALVRHCARLLENGCDGINLLGTTGEATSLSTRQRLAAMEAVAAAELPLERFMVGTGASALDDAILLTAKAEQLAFGGTLVIPPFYYKGVSEDGVFRFYETLIERVRAPALRLYLYHFPQLSGVPITEGLV